MRYGATTVIDATHNSTKSFKKYKPLAKKYGYKVYCMTFKAPIPELMRRNAARPAYKVVPPDCIYAMAHKVESQPTPDWVKDITALDEFYADEAPSDLTDKYDTIKVIGDVHGYMCKEKFLYYIKIKQLRGYLNSYIKAYFNYQPLPQPKQAWMKDVVDKTFECYQFDEEELKNLHVIDAVWNYEYCCGPLVF